VLSLGKRAIEAVILLVALYAFVFVPLGERTLWQHTRAIFSTPEARQAGRELTQAGGRMLHELTDFEARPVRGEPKVPELATTSPRESDSLDGGVLGIQR
jgi:hypothetical protein